jgi:protein-S-isoprenylcysteine O-methyltransferase Ste14
MPDRIFEILWVAGFVVASAIRVRYGTTRRRGARQGTKGPELLLLFLSFLGMQLFPLIFLLTSWLGFADYRLPALAGWFGVGVYATGLWVLWRSHVDLGRSFSPTLEIKEGHVLVTGGVFARIRHPMYAGHLLWAIGQPFLLQNWIAGWGFLLAQVLLYAWRVPREEKMMLDHFGEAYREYMSRTGRLIPRL